MLSVRESTLYCMIFFLYQLLWFFPWSFIISSFLYTFVKNVTGIFAAKHTILIWYIHIAKSFLCQEIWFFCKKKTALSHCFSFLSIFHVPSKLHTVKTNIIIQTYHCFGYALDLLVTVSSMCYHTSTSALSTSSSSRGLTNLTLWDISSWGGLHA